MMVLFRRNGDQVMVEGKEQSEKGPPENEAEREEVYDRIRAELRYDIERPHEQPEPCSERHPSFRGRPRK